jgi:hypothetical protein
VGSTHKAGCNPHAGQVRGRGNHGRAPLIDPGLRSTSTGCRVASRKPLRDDTEALAAMLYGIFRDIRLEQRDDAVREFAERLAEIHEAHGRGVPEWLVRLRARLRT